jgi:hypothetical protein
MATPKYFDPADIETQARYRPGVASNIFNVLTGGLAGQITGSTQKAQEAARARQALLQEEFGKRDEQRMLDRQLMINALQQGIELSPNGTLEQKMADFRNKSLRKQMAAAQGKQYGYGEMGPFESQADPSFNIAAGQAQAEMAQRAAELRQRQELEAPELAAQLGAFGEPVPPGATAGQLKGLVEVARMRSQSQIPAQMRQEDDKTNLIDLFNQYPGLKAFGSMSEADVQKLPASAARGYLTRAGKELETSKTLQNKEAQANAFTRTMGILNLPFEQRTTPENLQALYADSALVGKNITDSPKWQATMGLGPKLEAKELDNVKSYAESLQVGNNFARLLADVAKQPGGLKKFQENNFGTIANAINTKGSKFFSSDAERELARALVQEYEAFRQGPRKFLFGASLTSGEQESANISFGTPTDKDFFNRAVQFIDRVQQNDPVTFYLDAGKSINEPVVANIIAQKKAYSDYRNSFYPTLKGSSKTDRIQELRGELNALRSALTNAPSATR